jgi:hypothetical protein
MLYRGAGDGNGFKVEAIKLQLEQLQFYGNKIKLIYGFGR